MSLIRRLCWSFMLALQVALTASEASCQEAFPEGTELSIRGTGKNDKLNLREWANAKSATLLELPNDASGLISTGRSKQNGTDTWVEVEYASKKGWVNAQFLRAARSKKEVAAPIAGATIKAGITLRVQGAAKGDKLNMRESASAQSKIVEQLPPETNGIIATGRSQQNEAVTWVEVKYGKKIGWVNSRFVQAVRKDTGQKKTEASSSPIEPAGGLPAGTKLRVQGAAKGDNLNMRAEASGTSAVIIEVPAKATGIEATGRSARKGETLWLEVHFAGQTGWVNARFVRQAEQTVSAKGQDEQKGEKGTPLRERPAPAEPPAPASDAPMADCDSDDDLRKLSGCSAVIAKGALPEASIAIARSRRADAFLVAGDYDNAIIDLVAALGIRPGDEALSKRLAHAYELRGADRRRQGNAAGALADYTEAVRLDPTNPAVLAARAGLNVLKNDYDAAIADLEAAARLDNANTTYRSALARLHEETGVASLSKGDVDQAIDSFSAAIKLEPDREVLYVRRAAAREGKKDLSGALADYSEAKRLNPSNVTAYLQSGSLSLALGDSSGAIGHLDEAIRRNSLNVAAYMMRGLAFEEARRPDRATADYQTVLKLDPSNKLAKTSLDRVRPRPAKPPVEETGAASLRACCIAYCRIVECNSPPLPRACSASMIARYYVPMGIAYAKKNFLAGAKAVLRRTVSIPECQ